MRSVLVGEHHISTQSQMSRADAVAGSNIHLLIFESLRNGSTNTLSRQLAVPPILIWVPWGFRSLVKLLVGEQADLVSVEDVRCATTVHGLSWHLGAGVGGQGIGVTPRLGSSPSLSW